MSLIHKLFKAILLPAIFLCNTAQLHAAADDTKDITTLLTSNIEQIYLGGIPYNKEVTYLCGDKLVGFIKYGASGTCERLGFIDRLKIESEFCSKGVGSHILKLAMHDLKNDGYEAVRLEARPFEAIIKDYSQDLQRLINFYEKNGFKVLDMNYVRAVMQALL